MQKSRSKIYNSLVDRAVKVVGTQKQIEAAMRHFGSKHPDVPCEIDKRPEGRFAFKAPLW